MLCRELRYTESGHEHRQYVYQTAAFCATKYTMLCFKTLTLREHETHSYKLIQYIMHHRISLKFNCLLQRCPPRQCPWTLAVHTLHKRRFLHFTTSSKEPGVCRRHCYRYFRPGPSCGLFSSYNSFNLPG